MSTRPTDEPGVSALEPGLGPLDLVPAGAWGVLAAFALGPLAFLLTADVATELEAMIPGAGWQGLSYGRVVGTIAALGAVAFLLEHLARGRPARLDLTPLDRAALTSAAGFGPPLVVLLLPLPRGPAMLTSALLVLLGPFVCGWLLSHETGARVAFAISLHHVIGCLLVAGMLGGLDSALPVLDYALNQLGAPSQRPPPVAILGSAALTWGSVWLIHVHYRTEQHALDEATGDDLAE